MEQVIERRTHHIRVVLENIFQPHNASAVMRSCECFGIQQLHVIENTNPFTVNPDVAMGSTNWINLQRHRVPDADNTAECIHQIRSEGFRIVATSLDPSSVPLSELPLEEKTSLWFGTEEIGLSDQVLQQADAHVHIPMLGFTQSFNISVSAAICLYEIRNRMAASGPDPALSESEKRQIYRHWLRRTVKNCEILERSFLNDWKLAR